MKNLIITLFTLLITVQIAYCQDIMTKKNGEDIEAKVYEITATEVKYRRSNNPDGPLFTIPKDDLIMIRYANGTKDMFNLNNQNEAPAAAPAQMAPAQQQQPMQSDRNMAAQGTIDARTYYKGKNSGAVWTGAATALFSPVLGLIPAVACATTSPSDMNLNYPDGNLMADPVYAEAYVKQARKAKKRKVWTGYGVGSGIWLLLLVLV